MRFCEGHDHNDFDGYGSDVATACWRTVADNADNAGTRLDELVPDWTQDGVAGVQFAELEVSLEVKAHVLFIRAT